MNEREYYSRDDYADNNFIEEEPNEFQRRQRGAKRESAKRQRAAQKQARQDLIEEEFGSRSRDNDRRAREKESKRRFTELKRIADQLEIKHLLHLVSQSAQYDCWGPDVASEKTRPSIGIFLNYTDRPINQVVTAESPIKWIPKLFGVWLYLPNPNEDQVYLTVGTKDPGEDMSQSGRSLPPSRKDCLLTIPYAAAEHSHIQERIQTALLNWKP